MKIVETHLESIKDGGTVSDQLSRLSVIFIWLPCLILEKEKWKSFFSESSCIKNIRPKVKSLLTDNIARKIHCPALKIL